MTDADDRVFVAATFWTAKAYHTDRDCHNYQNLGATATLPRGHAEAAGIDECRVCADAVDRGGPTGETVAKQLRDADSLSEVAND